MTLTIEQLQCFITADIITHRNCASARVCFIEPSSNGGFDITAQKMIPFNAWAISHFVAENGNTQCIVDSTQIHEDIYSIYLLCDKINAQLFV